MEDEDVYFYMKSYSPYENVEAKEYPAILAMTSLNDTRVLYVEPAKWVAALRHTKTDGHPVLLKTQMTAGHGGISGRYERWKEAAFQYAWLLATADGDHHGGGEVDHLFAVRQRLAATGHRLRRVRHPRRIDVGGEHRPASARPGRSAAATRVGG